MAPSVPRESPPPLERELPIPPESPLSEPSLPRQLLLPQELPLPELPDDQGHPGGPEITQDAPPAAFGCI